MQSEQLTLYEPWLQSLRAELSAPAENLAHMAHALEEDAAATAAVGAALRADAQAVARNCEEFCRRVARILEGGIDLGGHLEGPPQQFEGFVRHELRSPLNRTIQRCEILLEDLDEGVPPHFATELDQIRNKAWAIVRLIDRVATLSGAERPTARVDCPPFTEAIFAGISRPGRNEPGTILVVDDNEDNREIFSRKLRRDGHTVHTAVGGREAIARLGDPAASIDVILLDVIMPEMNGIQVLHYLKSHATLQGIPVIMISALDAIDSVVRCIEMGAEDYLPKTCDPVLLRARIGASLEKKRLRERETELLHAVLPSKLVHEYRETQRIIPRSHEWVGVLFLDIVGFTTWSEGRPPAEVVALLDCMVMAFEELLEGHPAEKIKTIGDAFMCTSGLLSTPPCPVRCLVDVGQQMIRLAKEKTNFDIRVGVHVGPIVAGKLGHRQFTFDLWGATVNLASRMESNGLPGRITLSPDAWDCIAADATATPRPVKIKGIREPMIVWDFEQFRG